MDTGIIVLIILSSLILISGVIIIVLLLKKNNNSKDFSLEEKYQTEYLEALKEYKSQMESLLNTTFNNLISSYTNSINQMSTSIQQEIASLNKIVSSEKDGTANYLEKIRVTLESSIKTLQEENSSKLDQMRGVVEEKMQETLNKRITASFNEVRSGLDAVMGVVKQMESVSSDVNSLSRVLSNVKTKGILGEIQLSNILSDILVPDQYVKNVVTKKGTKYFVEFAVKLPGNDDKPVLLPIDSKFPLEKYKALLDAVDLNDQALINKARNELKDQIKAEAKDIYEKYIDVPNTTDFGVLFLPTESLYGEVMNIDSIYQIQNDNHIMIAGPTNMASLLNSLSMGFKTLAIQKNSQKIGQVLLEVKKEFERYQQAVEEANKKISSAADSMDKLVTTRTKAIVRKLENVQLLDSPKEDDDNNKDEED